MAIDMDFTGDQIAKGADCIKGLYQTFTDCDCTMVEINPLAELTDGRVMVCDAKVPVEQTVERGISEDVIGER